MCHSDASYNHPFRTVMRAAIVLAVATPAVMLAYTHLVVVLVAIGALVLVAGAARVADVIGTRRALAAHEAECAAVERAHMQQRLLATPLPRDDVRVAADRPAALEAPAPRVSPEWWAEPERAERQRSPSADE